MYTKLWKFSVACAIVALIGNENGVSGFRGKRSPFKKHKIVVVNEQENQGEGWGAPPPPPVAPPPPPPPQETIIEHHHHWEVAPPPPPPPSSHSHSVRIEVNKGGGKFQEDAEQIKKFKAGVDATIDEIERDKQEKMEAFKKDAESKLDALAQIPHMIAGDIDFIGKKIAEDIERKKQKDEGVSIQIWKGKGQNTGGGHRRGSSEETVHHHHYYHERPQQMPPQRAPPPPPPRQRPPPPPPPPRKQYYQEGDALEGLYKFADVGTQFMDYLAGKNVGTRYRVPVSSEGSAGSVESGERGWSQGGGGGGAGKGFQINVWKSKGFRRR